MNRSNILRHNKQAVFKRSKREGVSDDAANFVGAINRVGFLREM